MSVNLSDWGNVPVDHVAKLVSSHGCTSKCIPNVPTISECRPQCGSRATRQKGATPPNNPGGAEGWGPGRAEWVGTQRVLLSESEGSIARHFEIKQVIDEGVGTHAADMRGKRALDHRLA